MSLSINNNILVINKPKGITSFKVVEYIKKTYKFKKVGHAGTLDPNATGVLIIGVNEGTKALASLILDDKEYIATIKFGISTSTFDPEGEILETRQTNLLESDIIDAIDFFKKNPYIQKPPIFSAIKINGKKLYEYARKNQDVLIPSREVKIYRIELLDFDYQNQLAIIKMTVSKGFYVRSFAVDFAKKLNTIAILADLIRTKSGNFSLESAIDMKNIKV